MQYIETKFQVKGRLIKVQLGLENENLFFKFGYNKYLVEAIKSNFEKRRWNPDDKLWSAPITQRNMFRLGVLQGEDVYGPWTIDPAKQVDYANCIANFAKARMVPTAPFDHQLEMASLALSTKRCIWAAEMRTGKTLSAILTIEYLLSKNFCQTSDIWWFGPLSALSAVEYDFTKWGADFKPRFKSYDSATKIVNNWRPGDPAPKILVCDESSRCKTSTALRTQAIQHITNSMRDEHGDECYIILMSGTPAPKTPVDWWSQTEIVQPGFLTEGHPIALRNRLAVVEERESQSGQMYPFLLGWKNDENRCHHCFQFPDHPNHLTGDRHDRTFEYHRHEKSINEVAKLKSRLKGMVEVWFKKDCIKLPPKRFEIDRIKPTSDQMNMAKVVAQTATRSAQLLCDLRAISDGFMYKDVEVGRVKCKNCGGTKLIKDFNNSVDDGIETIMVRCPTCDEDGKEPVMERQEVEIGSPKDQLLNKWLEQHDEIGRLNIYAGFIGSVHRVQRICHQNGWTTIRANSEGWEGETPLGVKLGYNKQELLALYDKQEPYYSESYADKVAFVGAPGAAGMGLNLVASPTTVFYSNTHNGEDRSQSLERGHGPGMHKDGGLIVDLFCLPTDEKVLNNLKDKRTLELMTLTDIVEDYR